MLHSTQSFSDPGFIYLFIYLGQLLGPSGPPQYFFFFFLLAALRGMRDLSFLTRDRTREPCRGSGES